ncbi:MAG TPA: hypothetical protein VKB07_04890 [Gaiellaceae bacterium]|nr:hypothetical protein [Gaiellaceae bacterium]
MTDAIDELRAAQPVLLTLHKALLDAERAQVEGVHGAMSGAEFLQLVSDPVRYGWLKPFSRLIVAIDDALNPRERAELVPPDELLDQARALVLPPREDTPFGRRYRSLLQKDPALVMAHSRVADALGRPPS